MKKVIKLTEKDLNRIVKRTLKESSYSQMEQQDTELPQQCGESHLKRVMKAMSENNDLKVKIEYLLIPAEYFFSHSIHFLRFRMPG